jgi:acetoin utilization deacetylase AcuC-like enzyme
VLVVHDERCLGHRVPPGFPERPERVERLLAGLGRDPRFRLVSARGARSDEALVSAIGRVHERGYVERFRRAVERGDGLLDTADNPISPGSFAAALGAVGATLAALEAALGAERRAFAAVRPPGHHAERDRAMGFCFFGNAAVAAERALAAHGLARVAIVDVDVHHGNGTQHLFEERGDVFYASLHQYPFYPGTGAAHERGRGAGAGATLDLPLAAGAGDEEWCRALREAVVPALERFRPELLVVSLGFDAWRSDPLAAMRVSEAGFAEWGRLLFDAADRLCAGRALAVLEGGYDVEALPRLAASFLLGGAEREAA